MTEPSKLNRGLTALVKTVVSLVLVALMIGQLHYHHADRLLTPALIEIGLLGVVIYLLLQTVCAIKWHRLAHAISIASDPWGCTQYYWMGMFLSLFLPTSIGGDVARVVMLQRQTEADYGASFTSVFLERLTGLAMLLMVLALGYGLLLANHQVAALRGDILFFIVAAMIGSVASCFYLARVCAYLLKHPIWGRWVQAQAARWESHFTQWPSSYAITEAFVFSMLFHIGVITYQWFLLQYLGADASWWFVAIVYALASLAGLFPLALNGMGVREATNATLLIQWGHVSVPIANTFSLAWLTILMLSAVVGGLVWLGNVWFKKSRSIDWTPRTETT